MRVIVAGGRDLPEDDLELIALVCDELVTLGATEVVSGCARGGDKIGEEAANVLGLPVKKFPAEWNKHGKAAGMIRNGQMASYADALIALPGGKGTANMVVQAKFNNLKIVFVSKE